MKEAAVLGHIILLITLTQCLDHFELGYLPSPAAFSGFASVFAETENA